ncbi:MAG TPA: ABC transporter permease [Actinomycetota bacterium]|nr:ABC transporter permease [Actinomycetota bacterium]
MSTIATAPERAPAAELPPLNEPRKRLTRFILPGYTILMMLYLMSPIFLMILYGFNDVGQAEGVREVQTPKFWGFTLHWYRSLFDIPNLTASLKHSIAIAIPSAIVATILGTLLGLVLGRYRFRGQAPTMFIIFLAIAVPEIVLGSSLLSMFIGVSTPPLGFWTVLLSHISFSVPFVAITVRARVQGMDRSLEDASQDLFASPIVTFFRVTLPMIMPGILAGGLLAFVLSLDDFVITNFVFGSYPTFPVFVWGSTRLGLPPQVNVMGTLLFATGILLTALTILIQRRRAA